MVRMVREFGNVGCLFEAVFSIVFFNGGKVSAGDGPGSVYHSMESPSLLGVRVAEPVDQSIPSLPKTCRSS